MAKPPIAETLARALQHHQAGRLDEAGKLYQAILARDPRCADALHFLGVVAHQRHDSATAVDLMARAERLAPKNPALQSNLGEAYRVLGRLNEAEAAFRRALKLTPDFPNALNNLANVLAARSQFEEAMDLCRRAIALQPDLANAHNLLGAILEQRGELAPAIACYRQAVAIDPGLVDGYNNLGCALTTAGDFDAAAAAFQQALTLQPGSAQAHSNLGNLFRHRGNLDEALACYERALQLAPDLADIHNNRGGVLKEIGRLDAAIASHRRAVELAPHRADFHSNLIFALQYGGGRTSVELDVELHLWAQRHAPQIHVPHIHAGARDPDRPLRVGYVSHDLRHHAVAFFLLPLFEHHDPRQFQVVAYSTHPASDGVTEKLRATTHAWRNLVGLSDPEAARQIRADAIDVLIDLGGHTAGNRLPVFALRPAPVQIGYLGYPGRTGVPTIAYRLTDGWVDPTGTDEPGAFERCLRLPETAWCFSPLSGAPPISHPVARRGRVTFGCFNNRAKITDEMLLLWARLLDRVPGSHLAIKNMATATPSARQWLVAFFATRGIAPERLEILPPTELPLAHLESYNGVDIALDTFPYHGTTTTCEALWMGVPVVTLAGSTPMSRVGVSLLNNVGLPQFIAESADAYVDLAVATARDLSGLASLRAGLRERMKRSPLMDGPRFARAVEAAYRYTWERWCTTANSGPAG